MAQKGYTLIELIVVISVISIVVVVSPVSRNIYRTLETLVSVRNIMLDFRWARYQAINDNRELRVKVFREGDQYEEAGDSELGYIIFDDHSNEILRSGSYPNYLILYKNLNEKRVTKDYYDRIKFKYDGTALHGTVGFKYGSRIYKIVVSRLGRVRIAK
ncbi:MAG: GspH/FimT family protein [Halanaerobiales bacterium]